jgi:transcriptional regulator with XRE-family HTH domain
LKEWRLKKVLTQEELGRRAGVGEVTVNRIEGGQKARISTIRKLADALGIRPEQLIEPENAQHYT